MPQRLTSFLFSLVLFVGCNTPPQKTDPQPPPSSSAGAARSRWAQHDDATSQRHARIEALAQRSDPCRAGYAMRCSDNQEWFNCSCADAEGKDDPSRRYWTQVAEPDRYLGKMWLYVSNDLRVPLAVEAEHRARLEALQADLRQRHGASALTSSLRVTRRGEREEWELIAQVDRQTCTMHYDGQGAFQNERCEQFHHD